MITVKIFTYGGLRKYTQHKRTTIIEIDSPKTIDEILKSIKIPCAHVYLVERDGQTISRKMRIDDDCELKLIPYLTGG